MRGEGDEGPGELHAGIAVEIASAHGVVDAHEMERLDGDDGGFFEDGEEGESSTRELVKVIGLGRVGERLDEGGDGEDDEEEGDVMGTVVLLLIWMGGLVTVDEGEGVVLELGLRDATEDPVDLVKVGVCEAECLVPRGEIGEDEVVDVGGVAEGGEGEGMGEEGEFWEGMWRVGGGRGGGGGGEEEGLGPASIGEKQDRKIDRPLSRLWGQRSERRRGRRWRGCQRRRWGRRGSDREQGGRCGRQRGRPRAGGCGQ